MANSSSSSISLFVNEKQITVAPKSVSNTAFTIKGNKKKLNLVKGNNTVRLVVDGTSSNITMFAF